MWWVAIMFVGILGFAWLIDHKRKKNNNTKHTKGINPGTKPGESSNHNYGEGQDW